MMGLEGDQTRTLQEGRRGDGQELVQAGLEASVISVTWMLSLKKCSCPMLRGGLSFLLGWWFKKLNIHELKLSYWEDQDSLKTKLILRSRYHLPLPFPYFPPTSQPETCHHGNASVERSSASLPF